MCWLPLVVGAAMLIGALLASGRPAPARPRLAGAICSRLGIGW